MGKVFEKQIKTIDDQGQKQIGALENLKDQNKQLVNDDEDKLLLSNKREIFTNIYNKRLDKIEELTKKIDCSNLIFTKLSTGDTIDFSKKTDPLTLLKEIRDGKITVERARVLQEDFNNNIKKLRKGNKNQEQKKTLANLDMLYNGRNEAIKFYEDYSSMILEAKKRLLKNKVEQDLKY